LETRLSGGEGGIRTHDTPEGIPDFESGAFGHSATSPRDPERLHAQGIMFANPSLIENMGMERQSG
jgi:hypothetical protein